MGLDVVLKSIEIISRPSTVNNLRHYYSYAEAASVGASELGYCISISSLLKNMAQDGDNRDIKTQVVIGK